MTHRYEVKIDDSILPELYTFDQLIETGILDDIDDNIKVRKLGEMSWITARSYPFADCEGEIPENPSSNRIGTSQKSRKHINYTNHSVPQARHSTITHCWNWGAFSFSWLWGIFNGLYWPLIIIALNFIPYFGIIVSLCLSILLGIKGNDYAWRIAKQKGISISSFIKLQSKWNTAGIIFFIFVIVFVISYIALALL